MNWTHGGCDAKANDYTYQAIYRTQTSQQYLESETVKFDSPQIPAFVIEFDGKILLKQNKSLYQS